MKELNYTIYHVKQKKIMLFYNNHAQITWKFWLWTRNFYITRKLHSEKDWLSDPRAIYSIENHMYKSKRCWPGMDIISEIRWKWSLSDSRAGIPVMRRRFSIMRFKSRLQNIIVNLISTDIYWSQKGGSRIREPPPHAKYAIISYRMIGLICYKGLVLVYKARLKLLFRNVDSSMPYI